MFKIGKTTRGHCLHIDSDTLIDILGLADFDTTNEYDIQADLDKLHSKMFKIGKLKT